MKFLTYLTLVVSFLFPIYSFSEDRGGHCQTPSCFGARFGKYCAGGLMCGIGFKKVEMIDGRVLCIMDGSDPKVVKCKDGKEVKEEKTSQSDQEDDDKTHMAEAPADPNAG